MKKYQVIMNLFQVDSKGSPKCFDTAWHWIPRHVSVVVIDNSWPGSDLTPPKDGHGQACMCVLRGHPRYSHCQRKLISVCNALQVHLYNMFGTQLPRHFSMGSEVQREGILDCQLYGDGLVVLTKGLQLWAVSGLAEPRPQKLASPALKEPPTCMAIFQPRHTLSGCLEVNFQQKERKKKKSSCFSATIMGAS